MDRKEVETEAEVRARRKQHQTKVRRGSLITPERKLTEAQLKADEIRRRKQEHQAKLKGGK